MQKKHNFNQTFTILICEPEIKLKYYLSPVQVLMVCDSSMTITARRWWSLLCRSFSAERKRLLCRAVDENRRNFDYFLRALWGEFCYWRQAFQLDNLIWGDALEWANYKHWHRTTFKFLISAIANTVNIMLSQSQWEARPAHLRHVVN